MGYAVLITFLAVPLLLVGLAGSLVGLWLLKNRSNGGVAKAVGGGMTVIGVTMALFAIYIVYALSFGLE